MIRYEIREELLETDSGDEFTLFHVYRDKHNPDEWDYEFNSMSVWSGMFVSREDAESAIAYLRGD